MFDRIWKPKVRREIINTKLEDVARELGVVPQDIVLKEKEIVKISDNLLVQRTKEGLVFYEVSNPREMPIYSRGRTEREPSP